MSDVRRLKQLEEENRKLKQLAADLSLDKVILQDALQRKLLGRPTCVVWPEPFRTRTA